MKISEIIKKLQEEQKKRGDIDLKITGADEKDYGYYEPWDDFKIIEYSEGPPVLFGCPSS